MLDVADFLKRAATTIAGAGAAAFDMVRTERLPKNLCDDYTAFSLATVGYAMLHATARAFDDDAVATLAESHLRAYVTMTNGLMNIIPGTVVTLLREEGHAVDEDVVRDIEHRHPRCYAPHCMSTRGPARWSSSGVRASGAAAVSAT